MTFATHTARLIARLGRTVTVTPAGGPAREVVGILDTQPADAFGIVDGYQPMLRLSSADANGLAVGDAVDDAPDSYTITRIRPDREAGDVTLHLEAA